MVDIKKKEQIIIAYNLIEKDEKTTFEYSKSQESKKVKKGKVYER